MALTLRWVGEADYDRVAQTRWLCYSHAGKDITRHHDSMRLDRRAMPGDYLLAEENGQPVGTTTSLSMTMWVRGSALPCQGIAWVGTIKPARRRGGTEAGVASSIMHHALRKARERQQVISALMPFRVSYYEHFGYGNVERRNEWLIPMTALPRGNAGSWRLLSGSDYSAQAAMRQKMVQAGQCEFERPAAGWPLFRQVASENGMTFIHTSGIWVYLTSVPVEGKHTLIVNEWCADSPAGFETILNFLATLSDQYLSVTIPAALDWPINRLLRERQIPHRPVVHATASVRSHARLQMRILDHKRFLESLNLPPSAHGQATVAVHECEGQPSVFRVEFEAGRAHVKPHSGSVDLECADHQWAGIATGDMPAIQAVRFGQARENKPGAAALLDCLSAGPLPFTFEYF
jgi:predicted acetyltransferase